MELDLDVAAIANLEEILFEDKAVQTTEDVEELVQISVSLPEVCISYHKLFMCGVATRLKTQEFTQAISVCIKRCT